MSDLAIETRGLQKAFGPKRVLHGIDLTARRGELVGLVGKNGAGKSTLLRMLVGLSLPTAGTATVLGLDPAQHGQRIRERAAYLPGETSVYRQMTGQQFLDFALSFYPRRQEGLLRDLLDLFALPLQQRVRSYSAGMKQKLALIATLAPEQDLYLLDEPDRALDASVRLQLREVLQRLHRAGRTIVLCSHHLAEIETLADRLEFLLEGQLVPLDVVERARQRLQRRIRMRLAPGSDTPTGCTVIETHKDGTLVLEPEGDPVAVLQRVPAGALRSVELGVAHLEDLYQLLLAEVVA